MENYSYSSYPDSVNSSPRSREIDENATWDEQQQQQQPSSNNNNYKVKFMCSYGGKIHPRPHDNQLTYVGGETKILSVDRNIRFSSLLSKLSSTVADYDVCFKYQLPGEDLDALISVTNDEDLEHMMIEYDRLYRGSNKPARLRLFLFPVANTTPATSAFGSTDSKPESQWFVDALNSVQLQDVNSPPPPPVNNPDFLFGLEKGQGQGQGQGLGQTQKIHDLAPATVPAQVVLSEEPVGVMSPTEYQRQIHEMQRLHIGGNRKVDEMNTTNNTVSRAVYSNNNNNNPGPGEYYQQKLNPYPAPVQQQQALPMTNAPAGFWPERGHMGSGPYPATAVQTDAPVYIVQTPAGVFQAPAIRPPPQAVVGGGVGGVSQGHQAYYGMPRVVPEVYREQQQQPVFTQQQQQKMVSPHAQDNIGVARENIGMARGPHAPPESAYQIGYDSMGRQVYYTAPPPSAAIQQPPPLQHPVVSAASGGALNPDARIVGKP